MIFNPISVLDARGISYEIVLREMPLDFTDDRLVLVRVMAAINWANVDQGPCRHMAPLSHIFHWKLFPTVQLTMHVIQHWFG